MNILRVGDPHIKPSNIMESESLLGFVLSKALEFKVDRVEILGDLFDTHDIVRLKVLEFWQKWLTKLSTEKFETVVLVGNHDLSGDYNSTYSALTPLMSIGNGLTIVDRPHIDGFYGYLPYIHDNQKFIEEANNLANSGATVLVSHPNYAGAVYDNGHTIDNGVSDSDIDHRFHHLIGGHIHTELELGRIWYTGNPRWLTKSCANKKKGIWLIEHSDTDGKIQSKQFISTAEVCTPIVSLKWSEGEDKPEIPKNAKVDVELVGSSDWVQKTKKDLIGSVSVSSKITDIKKSRERKSGSNLHEFLLKHYTSDKKDKLINYMKGLELLG